MTVGCTPEADVQAVRISVPIGRARQQGQGAIYSKIHPLKHAATAGIVPGQVIHAFLAEDQEAVETGFGHLLAGVPLPASEFLAAEMEAIPPYRSFENSGRGLR